MPIAFPLPQWLHIRASVLRYTYIACLLKLHVYNYLLQYYSPFFKMSAMSVLSRDMAVGSNLDPTDKIKN
jgi:hypothetical protein